MAKLVKKINSNRLNGYFSIEFVRPPVLHIIQYMVRLHPSPTAAPQLIIPEKTVVLPEYQELRLGGDELQAHSRVSDKNRLNLSHSSFTLPRSQSTFIVKNDCSWALGHGTLFAEDGTKHVVFHNHKKRGSGV